MNKQVKIGAVKSKWDRGRAWLTKNKIFFETIVSCLLAIMAIFVSAMAVFITFNSNKLIEHQNSLLRSESLPQFHIIEAGLPSDSGIQPDKEIFIYNYGKPIRNLSVNSATIIRPNKEMAQFTKKDVAIDFYTTGDQIHDETSNLKYKLTGIKDNNKKYFDLVTDFFNKSGVSLDRHVYLRLSYINALEENQTEYYHVKDLGFQFEKISNEEGGKILTNYSTLPNVELDKLEVDSLIKLYQ